MPSSETYLDVRRLASDIRDSYDRVDALANNAVAFDPGNVRTAFGAENNNIMTRLMYRTPLSRVVLISPEKGGSNHAHFLTGPGIDWHPGRFYSQQKPAKPWQTNKQVRDESLNDRFWRTAAPLAGIQS